MISLSSPAWGFLGILVTQTVVVIGVIVGVYVRVGKNSDTLDAIGTAVNHAEDGEPTLVQRVANVEAATLVAAKHRRWEIEAFGTLARHVGCHIPQHPYIDDHRKGDNEHLFD